MAKGNSYLKVTCLAVILVLFNEAQAQLFPFSLSGSESDNECYVQCPMECPQLNLNMVDCVVYCKMKCACKPDDSNCITQAMDKMQKAADERESAIGPEEEAAEEAEAPSDAPSAEPDEEATDGDFTFATEDGERGLPPGSAEEEIDTTSSVIEMDLSATSQDADAPASEGPAAAGTPGSAPAATPQSAAAPTPTGATAPTPQGAASPAPQTSVSPAPQTAASPTQKNSYAPAPSPV